MPETPSVVEVTRNGNQSTLTACRSVAPLKLLNPAAHGDYCAVVLSSYGGGMVQGDTIILRVRCGKQASLYLGTQAFTKVYKNPQNIPSKQTIMGTVETGGLAIVLPDPVVPYAQSMFEQNQEWRLATNTCLVLADGHTSGRLAHGEHFAYTKYSSNITIHTPDRPLLIERYLSEPATSSPQKTGAFGTYNVIFNIFIAGTPGETRYTFLTKFLQQTLIPSPKDVSTVLFSVVNPRPELFIIRALVHSVEALHPIYHALGRAIAQPNIFGADPLARKY